MIGMRSWLLMLLGPSLLVLASCSDAGDPLGPLTPDPPALSYVTDVQPIFDANCIVCHGDGGNGGLDLRAPQSHGNLVDITSPNYGARRVVPNDPDESVLIDKLEGGGRFGSRMPPSGEPLSSTQLATLRQWVADGARSE